MRGEKLVERAVLSIVVVCVAWSRTANCRRTTIGLSLMRDAAGAGAVECWWCDVFGESSLALLAATADGRRQKLRCGWSRPRPCTAAAPRPCG